MISDTLLSMRNAVRLFLLLITACGTGQVVDAPDIGLSVPETGYVPCNSTSPCPAGQICQLDICVPDPNATTSGGTSGGQDVTMPPPVPDTNAPTTGTDTQSTGNGDSAGGTGTATGMDTAPPPPDECTIPGGPNGCENPTLEVCRVEPTGQLSCSSSTVYKPFGVACQQHVECDILYGCHLGICTRYCQLLWGDADCSAGELSKCIDIGHPEWGACGK
jgi:hypothetical protein